MRSIDFLYITYFLAIISFILTVILTSSFVIPLQIKEARIRDGLLPLRKQLLKRGILIISVSIFAVVILVSRYFLTGEILRYLIGTLMLAMSLAVLGVTIFDLRIYRSQYSEESLKDHEKIDNTSKHRGKIQRVK